MILTPYDVAILRAVLGGRDTVEGVADATSLASSTVRHRVRSLAGIGAMVRHPGTGVLSVTLGGRDALDRAERGGAA